MPYKISICIPTYNREVYLEKLIRSIQLQSSRNDVQICISDNASTDGTSTLLKKLGNSTQNIKYKIQPSNLGPDKNYFEAVRLADAEYCWLMGSDDEIEEDSLAKILEEIENSKNKIYLAPRVNCSITMERLNTEHWLADTTKKYYDFTEKKGRDEYFNQAVDLGAVFSYLSSIIVLKRDWDCYPPPEHFFKSAYSHTYTLLHIADGSGVHYLNFPIVKNRMGNDHFAKDGRAKRIMLDMHGYLLLSKELYAHDANAQQQLLSILRRSHPEMRTLSALRSRMNKKEWMSAEPTLIECGYSHALIRAFSFLGSPLKNLLDLKHKVSRLSSR